METICRNLESVVQMLAVSQSQFASQWDGAALARAFRWARYCQDVHAKFHADEGARRSVEGVLWDASARLGGVFGHCRDLTFSDLAACQSLLCSNLMQNPAARGLVIRYLFDGHGAFTAAGQVACEHPASRYFGETVGAKAATRLLSHFWESGDDTALHHPAIAAQGHILKGHLEHLLPLPNFESRSNNLLDSIWHDCRGDMLQVAYVLAAAVLSDQNKTGERTAHGVVVDWLRRDCDRLQTFCRILPVAHLTQFAKVSTEFRKAYGDVLRSWADTLKYDVNQMQWVQTSVSAVSFRVLLDHFQSLGADPSLNEETEKVLMTMKTADGNFDVGGLSVAGDILAQLKK